MKLGLDDEGRATIMCFLTLFIPFVILWLLRLVGGEIQSDNPQPYIVFLFLSSLISPLVFVISLLQGFSGIKLLGFIISTLVVVYFFFVMVMALALNG